ncbi:hypothetical protein GLOTRDRAFT_119452 [Gloeophyllum trabeum ATCC 11539]|uniref:Uncharacterized protein n=1 Tax=Gloeophyllum trabeum (strain ATCC 11539 / FP-39264 / Madison 617) TaxID=670483 RepID=S7RWI6_GLOTA|nr:uncharacterized protein GLOTRDRAFT_119452 [Gloeophyllum trabeum ATCC 11539]EPQ59255.1 hypothetical protein GLOTRDRAFT_119452 [Gloeophyllum trabeum ATCC 11539]
MPSLLEPQTFPAIDGISASILVLAGYQYYELASWDTALYPARFVQGRVPTGIAAYHFWWTLPVSLFGRRNPSGTIVEAAGVFLVGVYSRRGGSSGPLKPAEQGLYVTPITSGKLSSSYVAGMEQANGRPVRPSRRHFRGESGMHVVPGRKVGQVVVDHICVATRYEWQTLDSDNMAPGKGAPSASILFHPKKPKPGQAPPPKAPGTPRKAPPKPPPKDDDLNPPRPEGEYIEYQLESSALNGWKYDLMKFDSRRPVDVGTWVPPVKLNRKEPRRELAPQARAPQAVGPMLGPDGKPVIGADGNPVMVDAEGRPIHNLSGAGVAAPGDKKNGRKKFQKKTRQVYLIPEEVRQLRKEERYPWVMEDASGQEVWVGKMEEVSRSETHAFFMPTANEVFKFVPANRWYKFQKKPNYRIPNLEEAESMMAKIQKNKDPGRWLPHNRTSGSAASGSGGGGGGTASVSMPYIQAGPSLVYDAGTSLGPGGRRLRAVDSGMERGLFGDDDEEDSKRRRQREYGGEGDQDEMDYEEIFEDDEEKPNVDEAEDEEAKELEERMKKEYSKAKVLNDGEESEDEEDETKLTKAGRQLKKLMRSLEKNQAYESDDDENPYASEEEESEEEPPEVPVGPAVQDQSQSQSQSRSGSQQPLPSTPLPAPTPIKKEPPAASLSRPTSPTQSGHSIVAKRATSPPKISKVKTSPNVSRASSPLAQGPASPLGRPGSPVNGAPPPSAAPTPSKQNNKRKAEDAPTSPTSPTTAADGTTGTEQRKRKKRKPALPVEELTASKLVEWIQAHPGCTTKDCINAFRGYLEHSKDGRKIFSDLIKEVATIKSNLLILRPQYRGDDAPDGTTPGSAPATPGQGS